MSISINFKLENFAINKIKEKDMDIFGEWQDWDTEGMLFIKINGKIVFSLIDGIDRTVVDKEGYLTNVILWDFFYKLIVYSNDMLNNDLYDTTLELEETRYIIQLQREQYNLRCIFKINTCYVDIVGHDCQETITITNFINEVLRVSNKFIVTLKSINKHINIKRDYISLLKELEALTDAWTKEEHNFIT